MLKLKKPAEFVGSPCKYYTFRFFSLLQILIGIGSMIMGVMISIEETYLDWYSIGYISSGLIIFILALFSHSTYNSTGLLIAFLSILFLCFCGLLGLTLAVYLLEAYNHLIGSEMAQLVEYSLFGASAVLFLEFVFGSWYFSSVKDAELERENLKLLTRK